MRGIVFTEFLDFAGQAYPMASRPAIPPALGEALSPVANYPEEVLRDLVRGLAGSAGHPEAEVLRRFGAYLFHRFAAIYPVFFRGARDSLTFLAELHDHVHEDLRRFHPDAEIPDLRCEWIAARQLILEYRSPRSLADLAEGLIEGCIAYFGDDVRIAREDLAGPPGKAVRFTLAAAGTAPSAAVEAAS